MLERAASAWEWSPGASRRGCNGGTDDRSSNPFLQVGGRFGVAEPAVRSMLDRLVTKLAPFEARVGEIGLDERQTTDLARTMAKRRADLG